MSTDLKGSLLWILVIRSLHNALIEDGFDKLENNFSEVYKSSKWNFWVNFIRKQMSKTDNRDPNGGILDASRILR